MEFYSQYRRTPRMPLDNTNKIMNTYKRVTNPKTGERELTIKEKVDIVEKINEYADEVNINTILDKYRVNLSQAVKNNEEKLIDLTNMPENLMETYAIIDEAKHTWETAGKEIKKKFNNDFRKFLAGSENGEITKLVNEHISNINLNGEKIQKYTQPEFPGYKELVAQLQAQNEQLANLKANIQPTMPKTEVTE